MDKEEVKRRLKMAFWDTNHSAEELYEVLTSGQPARFMTRDRIYARLLGTYSWYKLTDIVPQSEWPALLNDKIIASLWPPSLKQKYKNVARILRKTALSATR
jgi:hypothetical protein